MNKQKNTYLYQDKSLSRKETDIDRIIIDIQNHIKDKEEFIYDKELLIKKNFIITPNSIERIKKISYII